jgi:hypothetical protein
MLFAAMVLLNFLFGAINDVTGRDPLAAVEADERRPFLPITGKIPSSRVFGLLDGIVVSWRKRSRTAKKRQAGKGSAFRIGPRWLSGLALRIRTF